MSDTNALSTLPSAARHAADITQVTAVEQARAIAEVQARVIVAQNNPRNIQAAIAEMTMACQQKELADRAFYNVPRAGTTVTDVSIHLAKELARCWGNVDYEVAELRRDDEKGYSEMAAWAWDMQANNKASIKFQVPHTRDMKTGSRRMNDINEIYNLLANMGSRRVREQILKILPTWFVIQAKALCYKTLEDGGGVPLPQRIAEEIRLFGLGGVSVERLERRLEAKSDKWTPHHLAQLQVIRTSLHERATTVEQEFPIDVITRDLLPDAPPKTAPKPDEPTTEQQATLNELLNVLSHQMHVVGHRDLAAALDDIRVLTRRPDLPAAEALGTDELAALIDTMTGVVDDQHPGHALDALLLAIRDGES